MNLIAYLKLMRFHKPVGILLLWIPTAWALWLANQGAPPLSLLGLFFLGTVFMRSAGCVINDIADRHVDGQVRRTKKRPLVSGEVSLIEGFLLLLSLLACSLIILIQLPFNCFYYALAAVLLTFLYPFCKRWIQGPQLILGLAFSMGIPIVFAASNALPDSNMAYLLLINFLWIVAYDTQYAMADRADDLRIGVKSTAIFFAEYDRLAIGILQALFHFLWIPLAFKAGYSSWFWVCWFLAGTVLLVQQALIAKRDAGGCLKAFSSNIFYGLLMWLAII